MRGRGRGRVWVRVRIRVKRLSVPHRGGSLSVPRVALLPRRHPEVRATRRGQHRLLLLHRLRHRRSHRLLHLALLRQQLCLLRRCGLL